MVEVADHKKGALSNTEGFKQTEVGLIPEDWEVENIGAFGNVAGRVGWKGYTKEDLRNSGPYTIGAKHIDKNNRLDLSDPTYLSEEKYLESPEIMIKKDDILIVQRGSIGKIVIIDREIGDATINPSMVILRVKRILPAFSYYYLISESGQFQILNDISSTGVPMITQKQVSEFKIPLPPTLAEQRTIASALSDMDALIAAQEKLIAKKRAIKQGAMQELMTGKRRLVETENKAYKQTEVGHIPEDWEVVNQKDVVKYINGRAYSKHEWENRGIPVVRLQNLTQKGGEFYYSTLNLPEKQYMNKGDLIFMWSASFGPYLWWGDKAIYHYHIWKIDCDVDLVDRLFYFFKLQEITEILQKGTSGSTMLHLTKSNMEKFKIALPPTRTEQTAIAKTLSDMDTEIEQLEAQLAKYRQVKLGMMQELLTGKKRLV